MRRLWPWALLVSCVALLGAGAWLLRPVQPAQCDSRPDDRTGYLVPICQYILANAIDVAPADPNRYQIKGLEERVDNGRAVVWVFLDCCFMGDIAIIDKESGAVQTVRPGAQ